MAKKKRVSISTILTVLILIVGIGICAYPTLSNWWNESRQTKAIESYITEIERTDPKVIEQMLKDAEAYNEKLTKNDDRYAYSDERKREYESLLNLDGSGIMGYIEIPALRIKYPIGHGTEETVLQTYIGHLAETSLPVGGKATHAALSGHRGLPSAKLFSDLDKLVVGDRFTITILNREMTYEIDQIRIVLPNDVSALAIDQEDRVTLITCTPYAINSHRLLVRAHRITDANKTNIKRDARQTPSHIVLLSVAIPAVLLYLTLSLIINVKKKNNTDITDIEKEVQYQYNMRKGDTHVDEE